MERIPSLRNIKEADAKIFKVKLWRPKKDKFGRKTQNFKDYINPEVSATEMKMRIFDPMNHICAACKRCVTA